MASNEATTIRKRPNPIGAVWRHQLVQAFFNDRITLISASFLFLIMLAAVFAPIVAPFDPEDQQVRLRHLAPLSTGMAVDDTVSPPVKSDRFFLLGTDHLGRDYLSRLIYGGRISISVGLLGVLVSSIIGVFLGVVAGFYRGVVDDVIMRAVDVFMAIPLLLLALIVLFVLGPSFTNIIIVFGVAQWMLY